MLPELWLPEAKTVISVFLPYTKEIKEANAVDMKFPANEWLHGRFEGQKIIDRLSSNIVRVLQNSGYKAISPSIDKRFKASVGTWLKTDKKLNNSYYYSNWSERHVAYAAGLGTFGLSKGLLTEKGITGRFTSIITNYNHEPTKRIYNGIYDYCTMCGRCIKNCPVNAISFEHGKDHTKCSKFIDYTAKKSNPRYGCGKCQVDVPCENGIPHYKKTEGLI
ncbi:MAG: 4Fe-4S binding protein [Bacteroidales bacterium]|jgi:epoxyqueuosine reductase QueG|nr:4Fe-4S binding protein [Bacteroidales bacterium]